MDAAVVVKTFKVNVKKTRSKSPKSCCVYSFDRESLHSFMRELIKFFCSLYNITFIHNCNLQLIQQNLHKPHTYTSVTSLRNNLQTCVTLKFNYKHTYTHKVYFSRLKLTNKPNANSFIHFGLGISRFICSKCRIPLPFVRLHCACICSPHFSISSRCIYAWTICFLSCMFCKFV